MYKIKKQAKSINIVVVKFLFTEISELLHIFDYTCIFEKRRTLLNKAHFLTPAFYPSIELNADCSIFISVVIITKHFRCSLLRTRIISAVIKRSCGFSQIIQIKMAICILDARGFFILTLCDELIFFRNFIKHVINPAQEEEKFIVSLIKLLTHFHHFFYKSWFLENKT